MLLALTLLAALVCLRILCSPWQSVHNGAWVTPRARAWPCTLERNCSTTSVWHTYRRYRGQWCGRTGISEEQFVRTAVAQGAIGGALIAALTSLPVDALIVIAGLIGVAGEADGLWNIRRVGNFFV
jgi:hypothetical protein